MNDHDQITWVDILIAFVLGAVLSGLATEARRIRHVTAVSMECGGRE